MTYIRFKLAVRGRCPGDGIHTKIREQTVLPARDGVRIVSFRWPGGNVRAAATMDR